MRLLEEACELAQAEGINIEQAMGQLRHVYARPAGHVFQEAGGVAVCLLGWCAARNVPLMAYSPLEQARLLAQPKLVELARSLRATPAQVALAWLLQRPGVIAIPKAADARRVEENFGALQLTLDAATLAELDRLFPPPRGPRPLEML